MATFKCTYFFVAQSNGWTESFYFDTSTYEEVRPKAIRIAEQRVRLLGKFARLDTIRTSDIDIRGDAEYLNNIPHEASVGGIAGPRDTCWNVWLCRMQATQLYRRSFALRGLPDIWLAANVDTGEFRAPDDMILRLNSFLSALNTQSAKLRVVSKLAADVGDWDITAMAFAGDLLTVTAPGHTLAKNNSVRITKGRYQGDTDIVAGVYKVTAVSGATFTVIKKLATFPSPVYLGEAKAQRRKPINVVIDDLAAERPGWRKTGRAFFVAVGRQKRRK